MDLATADPPSANSSDRDLSAATTGRGTARATIMLVEDDRGIRESLRNLLEDERYQVICAEDGRQAMERLLSGAEPDLIVLDLRMPVMDGWEFRVTQKRHPKLGSIPIVAISADGSPKAAAIDADAYLRKPIRGAALLETIGRVLATGRRLVTEPAEVQCDPHAPPQWPSGSPGGSLLARLAGSVGHDIETPLAYLIVHADLVAKDLDRIASRSGAESVSMNREELGYLGQLVSTWCIGLDQIGHVVRNLQKLSHARGGTHRSISLNDVLDQAIVRSRYRTYHRATIVQIYQDQACVTGDATALAQAFVNLLLNAADAVADGDARHDEITVRSVVRNEEAIVEISDTGPAIPAEVLRHLSTPPLDGQHLLQGSGLGLPVSWRIIADHGGRIEVFNNYDRGVTFRVVLPLAPADAAVGSPTAGAVGKVLVIGDDGPAGRTASLLASEHEVVAVGPSSEAFERLSRGEMFDVLVCDLSSDERSREFYERIVSCWPAAAPHVVFLLEGTTASDFPDLVGGSTGRILFRPFKTDELRAVVRARIDDRVKRLN